MKPMKRICSAVLAAVMILSSAVISGAATTTGISLSLVPESEEIALSTSGDTAFTVDVVLTDTKGHSGGVITVQWPEENFTLTGITNEKGHYTATPVTTELSTANERGEMSVFYDGSSVDNIMADKATVFTLCFTVLEGTDAGTYSMSFVNEMESLHLLDAEADLMHGGDDRPDSAVGTDIVLVDASETPEDGWVTDPETGKKHYIENGEMVKDQLVSTEDGLYYLDENGDMVSGQFAEVDGSTYYFTSTGEAVKDNLKYAVDGKYYGFDEDGKMLTGFVDADGTPLTGADAVIKAAYYYGDTTSAGAMVSGKYVITDSATLSAIKTEYPEYADAEELMFWFDVPGGKVAGTTRIIENVEYTFDTNGVGTKKNTTPEIDTKLYMQSSNSRVVNKEGQKFTVDVMLEDNSGHINAQILVNWPKADFKVTDIDFSNGFYTEYVEPPLPDTDGEVVLYVGDDLSEENITGNGKVATITFEVLTGATLGSKTIGFNTVQMCKNVDGDLDLDDIENVSGIELEVTNVLIGDVNRDGRVNILDATVIKRCLAGWNDYQYARERPEADIDQNGKLNILDATIFARYLAGWKQYTDYFK